ncbi:TPA: cation transporter, partial [Enterococcus faecium]
LVAAKADIVGNKENEAYSVINDIEKNMRQSLPDKKMYIYIETDKYDPNYSRK